MLPLIGLKAGQSGFAENDGCVWNSYGKFSQARGIKVPIGPKMSILTCAILLVLICSAQGICPCVQQGSWDAEGFIGSTLGVARQDTATPLPDRSYLYPVSDLMTCPSGLGKYGLLVAATRAPSNNSSAWPGVALPWDLFINASTVKPGQELQDLAGKAGLSPDIEVAVAGEPADAALVLWALLYIGQENASLVDSASWDRSEPVASTAVRDFAAPLRSNMLSTYEEVTGGPLQKVDARSFQQFAQYTIPGALPIKSEAVLDGGRLKSASALNETFGGLSRSMPVVVFSEDLRDAALVWYALRLMGFEASIYPWADWIAHAPPPSRNDGHYQKLSRS
ncbi:MAG TPA: rhodanese-like domain-containing protein [Methanotrichaceae archaeon]|nr:rhodanese-like domain-containing protein [Methanotrichaceae archaeon]HQF16512.1 rhodanese-like domain-containing protein [Methanotrichaceae archaeon]HQI91117.1 rhodanese-like domain-containing protein [Methanotrichaceae archaeon]HQJ28492.1 rhodanese-like domain-containing protein [Methanotrichaceae archaeon]